MPLVVSKAMHFLPHAEHLLSQTLNIVYYKDVREEVIRF